MGVGLQPLEFTECLADSPQFRENLQRHEKELERTSQQIKRLIKEVKDVVQAAKRLGAAQLALAASMEQFEFACIGASMTEDERVISRSLHHFAHLIRTIEDERDRMLGRAHEQIIQPLEKFRKEHIGAVKEGKKKFDKKTAKFCQTQERTLSLSTKKPENVFQEADAAMDMAERDFCQASLEYVFQLQAVQERKKFELVETLLGFVFGWWTFHHTAHDVHADAEPRVRDLQLRIQRTRSNFEETSKQTESLMKKMMEVRQMTKEEEAGEDSGGVPRAGYLFLMEKKAFGTTWSKQYCTYERSSRTLSLTPYNQINVKTGGSGECVCVCGGRGCAEPPERRFCWEAVPAERERPPLTLQALSERDRAAWLRALDGPPAPHAAPTARRCPSATAPPGCARSTARPRRTPRPQPGEWLLPGAVPAERERPPLTLQALSERDRAAWLRALDGPPAPHAAPTARRCPSATAPPGCARSTARPRRTPRPQPGEWLLPGAVPAERERPPLTLQALSERDRAAWLRALDGPPAPHAAPTAR
ncbi:rho GTPase-activating protein Graf-like [Ostrinia nubilalis]|uniref:rho GTPase-activating protein Graf-like n=1 Tax=Ostrinia nubilalis TaxID=29057 RepID=UPI0030823954